jgi:hypothetical protein
VHRFYFGVYAHSFGRAGLAGRTMKSGNLKEAEEYYQKALTPDAADQNAKGMLAKLRESKNQ